MTDIVERLRREAVRFNEMDAAGDQPWVADAAWAADNFSAAADEIERLRAERDALAVECYAIGENYEIAKRGQLPDKIERLREVLALGIHMREAQTTYFKTRSKDALVAAKALEAEFLHRARALLKESGR